MNISIHIAKNLFTQDGPRKLEYQLSVQQGELVGLFGPSGIGKSTLLRMIAGLTEPDEGVILVNDAIWYDSSRKICLPVEERKIGMVFQEPHLFPNMTVEGNLRFSMQPDFSKELYNELLSTFGLTELIHRKPTMLSGGQCQRVALARTLVNQPHLLLLDEPFSSLDWTLRWRLQTVLLDWHKRLGYTTILVSHDLLEITRMADRIHHLGHSDLNPTEIAAAAQIYQRMGDQLRIKSPEESPCESH